jgi:hypothetical protein
LTLRLASYDGRSSDAYDAAGLDAIFRRECVG